MGEDHHVAWSDRIGLSKIWFEDIRACSQTFGTEDYPVMVSRFENDMIDIKGDGPSLKQVISDYKDNKLDKIIEEYKQKWLEDHSVESQNPSYVRDMDFFISRVRAQLLYNFMLQLLEDEGFCFYRSNVEEDKVSLNRGIDDDDIG